jgi:DNA-binding MarR family transcriptional regulator
MARIGPPTVLFEVFWAQQKRKRLIELALAAVDLPPEDYPFYVMIGAEGPWTPTGLAERLVMPLSTVIFRVKRLEGRGHAERVPNPDDGRSFLIGLTPEGRRLLDVARPAFRDYAEAVEARLGRDHVDALTHGLVALRQAIDDELADRAENEARVATERAAGGRPL